ncbi:hypothetical protein OO012_00030 [Rhodobacteraceae bacterium KMM 6894]|nr:hypothetical protein [Rhodobacteraceae bacterium KMM 6894]
MTEATETSSKVHYICQTYVETKAKRGEQGGVKIDKQFEYSTSHEAESRAEREFMSEDCAGADAYMVIEDSSSGEVGEPAFIVRLGIVPDVEGY